MRGKLTIPSFVGSYDGEECLDWEMVVEQEFNSHLIPKIHRVKHATSELKDFTKNLVARTRQFASTTSFMDRLKEAMCDCFIPPYKHIGVRNCSA
jgi:hypothetical protein